MGVGPEAIIEANWVNLAEVGMPCPSDVESTCTGSHEWQSHLLHKELVVAKNSFYFAKRNTLKSSFIWFCAGVETGQKWWASCPERLCSFSPDRSFQTMPRDLLRHPLWLMERKPGESLRGAHRPFQTPPTAISTCTPSSMLSSSYSPHVLQSHIPTSQLREDPGLS